VTAQSGLPTLPPAPLRARSQVLGYVPAIVGAERKLSLSSSTPHLS
jgi:hypothetical protein